MGYKKGEAEREIVRTVSGWIPKFTDLFDEETFYIFALFTVIASIIAAILLSRYVKIRDSGHLD